MLDILNNKVNIIYVGMYQHKLVKNDTIDVFVFQRIKKLIRPRLRPHQLRPDDDPKDLIDYCQTHVCLDGISVIDSKLPLVRETVLLQQTDGDEQAADENNTPLVNEETQNE